MSMCVALRLSQQKWWAREYLRRFYKRKPPDIRLMPEVCRP
jgi:hypothetical protein